MKLFSTLVLAGVMAADAVAAQDKTYVQRYDDIMADVDNAGYLLRIAGDRFDQDDHYGACDAMSTAISEYYLAGEDMQDLARDVDADRDVDLSDIRDYAGDADSITGMGDDIQSQYDKFCSSSWEEADDDDEDSFYEEDADYDAAEDDNF